MSTDLQAAQNAMARALTQHAAYQFRASSAVVNTFHAHLMAFTSELSKEMLSLLDGLSQAEMQGFLAGKYQTARLKKLRDAIRDYGEGVGAGINDEWQRIAPKLAAYEAGYVASVVDKVVAGLPKPKIVEQAIYQKAMHRPMSGSAPYGGRLVQELLDDFGAAQAQRVMATLRSGVAGGLTNAQIVRAVRGTKSLNYQDGIVQVAKVDAERLIRTARTHVSNQAMLDTYEQLGVTHVRFMATLDGRTSKVCAALDGKRWRVGEAHPVPPLHPNCRSIVAPDLGGDGAGVRPFVRAGKVRGRDGRRTFRSIGKMTKKQREDAGLQAGQVAAKTTHGRWFANQDAAFQREWLGTTRYRLYKEGGYSIERFVDPLAGRQYSLEELKRRDAETFRQVFGA